MYVISCFKSILFLSILLLSFHDITTFQAPPPPRPDYEEEEKALEDFDESFPDPMMQQYDADANQNIEYQDQAAFLEDAKGWRKVLQQKSNYAVKPEIMVVSDEPENNPVPIPTTTTTTTEEPYETAVERLSCDNPWFWNSFKCLYLDVKKRNYVDRTTSNAKTVAWIIGPPITILVLMLCSFCLTICYLRYRVRQFERRIEEIRNKYEPGSIELDDGTVRKYTPNKEELDAFENMISTLISIV